MLIQPAGLVKVTGHLADGTPFGCAHYLHPAPAFDIYARIYKGTFAQRGTVRGTLGFPSLPLVTGDASGLLT